MVAHISLSINTVGIRVISNMTHYHKPSKCLDKECISGGPQLLYRQTELTMWVLLTAECGHIA